MDNFFLYLSIFNLFTFTDKRRFFHYSYTWLSNHTPCAAYLSCPSFVGLFRCSPLLLFSFLTPEKESECDCVHTPLMIMAMTRSGQWSDQSLNNPMESYKCLCFKLLQNVFTRSFGNIPKHSSCKHNTMDAPLRSKNG